MTYLRILLLKKKNNPLSIVKKISKELELGQDILCSKIENPVPVNPENRPKY